MTKRINSRRQVTDFQERMLAGFLLVTWWKEKWLFRICQTWVGVVVNIWSHERLGRLITLQDGSLKEVMDVAITYAPELVQSEYSINSISLLLSGLNNDCLKIQKYPLWLSFLFSEQSMLQKDRCSSVGVRWQTEKRKKKNNCNSRLVSVRPNDTLSIYNFQWKGHMGQPTFWHAWQMGQRRWEC